MTVSSLVQQGHQNQGYLDSGPYSADQWAAFYSAFKTTQPSAAGIRANYLNEFEGSNPSGANIQIETGAAIVNGRPILNDASLTFAVTSPSGNPRIDVLGLCLNNTGIARTAGVASGNTFLFPSDLTDYDGAAEIPPFTVRPVILTGTEAASPTAPTLDSDPSTLFMIPVASYEISTGGVVSDFVDLRRYDSISPNSLIMKREYGSGSGNVETVQLPQSFKSLKILFDIHAASGSVCRLRLRMNGDSTGGRYYSNFIRAINATITGGIGSTLDFHLPPALNDGWYVSGQVIIPFYSQTRSVINFTHAEYIEYEPIAAITNAHISGGGGYTPPAPAALTSIQIGLFINSGIGAGLEYGSWAIYGLD